MGRHFKTSGTIRRFDFDIQTISLRDISGKLGEKPWESSSKSLILFKWIARQDIGFKLWLVINFSIAIYTLKIESKPHVNPNCFKTINSICFERLWYSACVQIHLLIPSGETSRVPAFLSWHSRGKNTFQQNLSLDVTKVPWICRQNCTNLSIKLESLKESNEKWVVQVTQCTRKAGRARTCTQTALDVLTIFSGATVVHVLRLSTAQYPMHMDGHEISTAGTGAGCFEKLHRVA